MAAIKRAALEEIDHKVSGFIHVYGVFNVHRIIVYIFKSVQDTLHESGKSRVCKQTLTADKPHVTVNTSLLQEHFRVPVVFQEKFFIPEGQYRQKLA